MDIIKSMLQAPFPQYDEGVKFNIEGFIGTDFSSRLSEVNHMQDKDVFDFINTNINSICISIMQSDELTVSTLLNLRFFRIFSDVVSAIPLDYRIRLCVNMICYDYFIEGYDDKEFKRMAVALVRTINRKEIEKLRAIGLDTDIATNLTLAKFASTDEYLNIRRLNFVICSKSPLIMSEQMIVWIYEIFFDKIGDLFCGTMLGYLVPDDIDGTDENDEFLEILSIVHLSLLDIVNNLSTIDIYTLLRRYSIEWDYAGKPETYIRLKSISADYSRIQSVVDALYKENIYFP